MQRNNSSSLDATCDERLLKEIRRIDMNAVAKNEFLCIACHYGLIDTAQYLLDIGANPRAVVVAHFGQEIAKLCRQSGIDLNNNLQYKYPMQLALEGRHIAIAEKLAENGASVKAVFHSKNTLLAPPSLFFQALHTKNNEALEFLVQHGLDVNTRDREGLTPLHIAAMKNNVEAVSILLHAGAEPNAKTLNKKKTPKELTTNNEVKRYLDFYSSKNAQSNKGLTP